MRTIIKIHGSKATKEEITDEIYNLITGRGSKPYPVSITETARLLGVSRDTIYRYIKKMKGVKAIQKFPSGKLLLPRETPESKFCRFSSSNPIASEPLVAEWIDDLLTRKGGESAASWKTRPFSRVCLQHMSRVAKESAGIRKKHRDDSPPICQDVSAGKRSKGWTWNEIR